MEDKKTILKNITEVLISDETNYYELKIAINQLEALFHNSTGFDSDDTTNREDIYTSKGKAIGSTWAAACTNELVRTKMFIKGVYEAITEQLSQKETIHILYAGSGPFATLVVPLTTMFSSKQLQITALEINTVSISYLKECIKNLKLEEYFHDIIECDASSYQLKEKGLFDIFLTETMLKALSKEPQVAITLNLLPQLNKDVILIPESIKVDAAIINWTKAQSYLLGNKVKSDSRIIVKRIFDLNKTTAKNIIENSPTEQGVFKFPVETIELPLKIEEGYDELILDTTINTYANNQLSGNSCSLTLPYRIKNVIKPGQKIQFQYRISQIPKFEYTVLNA